MSVNPTNWILPEVQPTFPPMYSDSPVKQIVIGVTIESDDSLTAAITAGAPYFTVSAIDVCDWVVISEAPPPVPPPPVPPLPPGPVLPPEPGLPPRLAPAALPPLPLRPPIVPPILPPPIRELSPPVATSDGTQPLTVHQGQYARLWVTAEVPQGAALPPGAFTGTAVLTGKSVTRTVALQGTYQGSLIGKVTVEPQTAAPGQPVLVQACGASGQPLSDPTITVTIAGVPVSSRYYQFPTAGTYELNVVAVRGDVTQSAQATVTVSGPAIRFRPTLALPTVTEIPMLSVSSILGQPYAATFTLGNTSPLRQTLARTVAQAVPPARPPGQPAPAPVQPVQAPIDALGAAFAKVFGTVPADEVRRFAPTSTMATTGTATSSAVIAPVGGLQADPAATSYQWDFGDGQTLTTQTPTVTHDFLPAIEAGKIAHGFDVTCTVVHDNITVKRTLVLHSAYGLCRQLGVVVPPVTGDAYATFQQVAFSASLIVQNLEAAPITLDSMACVPLSDDGTVVLPTPQFTAMQAPAVIAAGTSSAIGVYIPLSQLQLAGAVVNGFTVYYRGQMQAGAETAPVCFSYAFRIPLSDSGLPTVSLPAALGPANWDHNAALQAVTGLVTQPAAAVSGAGEQTVDPATHTVAIGLSADPRDPVTLTQVRSAVQAGLTSIALKAGALTEGGAALRLASLAPAPAIRAAPRVATFDPLSPPPVAAGNECYPDDISDADAAAAAAQQLVCQTTGITETRNMPGSFQNAQAGDIILSAAPVGTGDMIAAMFRALSPPQHHGHSGIMTANFIEITHCTASVDRISANLNTVGPIPTSLNSDMLQYAWPGSLTQSIDAATSQQTFNDPSNTPYPLNSFNTSSQGDGFEVIPCLVVKPLPQNEEAVRPLLRQAADTARSKGAQYDSSGNMTQPGGCYYSFYAYTDPQLSAGFTDAAGAEAGWAQGLSPAVCSSFVWMCLKAHNIPLVTPNQLEQLSDFSQLAIAGGAQVGPATLDGLILYPQAVRLQGAQALYQMFMNQALSKEGGFGTIPGVNQAVAGPIADQLINDFAFGNPNMVGSPAWQQPRDANAVSPDNILWWNPPYYGYAEPLQYLPSHPEQYTISKWTQVISWGSIRGTVQANGAPVPNAHVWVYLPGGDTYTGADGSYTLNRIPIGSYQLKAQAVIRINNIPVQYTNGSGQPVTLTAANYDITQNLEMQGDPTTFRKVDFEYSISCDHGDGNPWNVHGVQTAGPYSQSIYVNPGQVTQSLKYSYDYNGGGYFHIDYVFTVALLEDLSVEVTLVGTMYDDSSGGVQDQYSLAPFNISMGGSWSGYTNMENANGYHNGPAVFTFTVANNQQTG
jgi:Carboxypeptidase regulatory-like domain